MKIAMTLFHVAMVAGLLVFTACFFRYHGFKEGVEVGRTLGVAEAKLIGLEHARKAFDRAFKIRPSDK